MTRLPEGFSHFVTSMTAPVASSWSGSRAGFVPDWIEFVSGWDPDQGDGSAEWLIVAGLCLVTIVLIVAAMKEWRRTTAVASP